MTARDPIVRGLAFQAKKLEYHWILYDLLRGFRNTLVACDGEDRLLIVAKQKALVEHRVDMTLKLASGQTLIYSLQFTILTLFRILD